MARPSEIDVFDVGISVPIFWTRDVHVCSRGKMPNRIEILRCVGIDSTAPECVM